MDDESSSSGATPAVAAALRESQLHGEREEERDT